MSYGLWVRGDFGACLLGLPGGAVGVGFSEEVGWSPFVEMVYSRACLEGTGLGRVMGQDRSVLWVVVSTMKGAVWARRGKCLDLSTPCGSPDRVFFEARWFVWVRIREYARVEGDREALRVWGALAEGCMVH